MSSTFQQIFDRLYQFSREIPGAEIKERTDEWESGGQHREVHTNLVITVSAEWESRPFMLIFQADPPSDPTGVELFLSAMQAKGDIVIRSKSLFRSFFARGKLKPRSSQLARMLEFTCPKEYREAALGFVNNPELEPLLLKIPWDQIHSLQLQDASGVSLRFPPDAALYVNKQWLETWLGHLVQLMLLC